MKNLLLYKENNLEHIVCALLVNLTYGSFDHSISRPEDVEKYDFVWELKDETVKSFQERLVDSYEQVRTEGEASLRILDSDIASLIHSVDSKDKKYHVLSNLLRMLGTKSFFDYLSDRFRVKRDTFQLTRDEIINSDCLDRAVNHHAQTIENRMVPLHMLNYSIGLIVPDYYSDLVGSVLLERNPQYDFILSCDFNRNTFFIDKKEKIDIINFVKSLGGSMKNGKITIPLNPTTLLLFEQYLPYPQRKIGKLKNN